tara:strand:+ start:3191 stop:4123 length:933 start_codon:yes stop_codon:yes gene_type:complete
MRIVTLDHIKSILPNVDLLSEIESGFAAYSSGLVVVPPVGELSFQSPPGDVHIKYGYINEDDVYVIKIASGFYENKIENLPVGNGMMLVFSQKTGQPLAMLQDECYLTDVRTAVAGAITAKHLSPKNIDRIGIVGTGTQAKLQLQYLKDVIDCNKVVVWGRSSDSLSNYIKSMDSYNYQVEPTASIDDIVKQCQLIITCTPSEKALIDEVNPGTHITAIGSDTTSKRELSSKLLFQADVVITDSKSQCKERGEIYQASKDGFLTSSVLELGDIINGIDAGRVSQEQITVADLTGVAVQDIQISKAILRNL